jgi:hypothetical protein
MSIMEGLNALAGKNSAMVVPILATSTYGEFILVQQPSFRFFRSSGQRSQCE